MQKVWGSFRKTIEKNKKWKEKSRFHRLYGFLSGMNAIQQSISCEVCEKLLRKFHYLLH